MLLELFVLLLEGFVWFGLVPLLVAFPEGMVWLGVEPLVLFPDGIV